MQRSSPAAHGPRAHFSRGSFLTDRFDATARSPTRLLAHLRALLPRSRGKAERLREEPALRSELFSAEQMEQHGATLARAHVLGTTGERGLLLLRLEENEAVLLKACDLLIAAIRDNRPGTPAGEWLLDNFHLVEEQIRTARRHLPRGYSGELPRLAGGPAAGYPRVYDLALQTIAHGDGQVDLERFSRFLTAYQAVVPLALGELWAVPIMLRLALIENLRRAASRIIAHRAGLDLAERWAEQMLETAQQDPKSLILVVADMARSEPPMNGAFVAELSRRLHGQSAALSMPLNWIEQRLSEMGLSTAQLVQSENQQQAADQVSISNSIGSLRLLTATDWHAFVERMSVVERLLREDPAGIHARVDFETRDGYRHVVERISRASGQDEARVTRECLQLARAAAVRHPAGDRRAHVGYYLVGKGLPLLEAASGARIGAAARLRRRHTQPIYFGLIAALSAGAAAALLWRAHAAGAENWALVIAAALALPGASQLAVAMVNWLATRVIAPQPLPRMDYAKGIAAESRTLAVIPTLLTAPEDVEALAQGLEVRFLANRDDHLQFALLTDFADAPSERMPEDEPLLQLAVHAIVTLNARYGQAGGRDTFFLLHRPRRWNPGERAWMGHERKRGKLGDLNGLLRGSAGDAFSRIEGRVADLAGIRYVITLDTDTQLPRDAARRLAATMAHPLNQPLSDPSRRCILEGYAILQPRVAASLPDARLSRYARMHGDEAGIDPYTRTVSDVYQDLFGEGSYTGKGIYDVDAFELALKGRLPENRVLSHDLLEGCYARCGLASDVQLYEEYPARFGADLSRRLRWMRGDWQLAGWLRQRVPRQGGTEPNPLSGLSQWKIFDNLRRSVVPPTLALLLIFGWSALPHPWLWTLAVLAVTLVPALSALLVEAFELPASASLRSHVLALVRSAGARVAQAAFAVALLPVEACAALDAILRAQVRLQLTGRLLLQWTASARNAALPAGSLRGAFAAMWIAPCVAAATAAGLALARPEALAAALPVLALWAASPVFVWWLERPHARDPSALAPAQTTLLRLVARKTWAYFEHFVVAQEHWLPPDNVQQVPVETVAHRTSPTNMGLSLLANLTALDLGYVSVGRFLERTRNSLATMHKLERYRGHFLNWYDTRSLQPLPPAYVSTVDSGNLAGHLLTLRVGLEQLGDQPVLPPRWLEGIEDTYNALLDAAPASASVALLTFQGRLVQAQSAPPGSLPEAREVLQQLTRLVAGILEQMGPGTGDEAIAWARALHEQCASFSDDVAEFPEMRAAGNGGGLPTLRRLAAQGDGGARLRLEQVALLAAQVADLARLDYAFLYDEARHLLAIGYNVTEQRRDAGYYDLLASEARLAVFVGIAQGKLPQQSWFALGRLLVDAGSGPTLLSWSGSMFEYLMPLLVMPGYDDTLLAQSCRAAVRRQIAYGAQRGVPWGISECGYSSFDAAQNYQYRAFGVPGLGLMRGLSEDLVIAPYASVLALLVAPRKASENLQRLTQEGFLGRFGFYEAIDYTAARVRRGEPRAVVQSFMAHHQAMSLLALAHQLLDRPMQRRFAADPNLRATLLLLQERIPRAEAIYAGDPQRVDSRAGDEPTDMAMRVFDSPDTRIPGVQLLSNGRYHVMVTNAGSGYSRWKDLAVTRWREDKANDGSGVFCYLRELDGSAAWSAAFQPTLARTQSYEAVFTEQRVEFRRHDRTFETHVEIVVSPEDDVEVRRVRVTNRSRSRRILEATSYAEVVLAPAAADALHPAFSNLFVQTEVVPSREAIFCMRRPRSRDERTPWLVHLMAVHGAEPLSVSFETDRSRFLGRGHGVADPEALRGPGELSGSEGSVLDPIVAIRRRVALEPDQAVIFDLVIGVGESRAACLGLAERYQDRRFADRAFEMAWTHSHVALRQINVTEADAQLYARLASSIIFANPSLRADAATIGKNRRGQPGLWGYAISGDLPIVLVQLRDPANLELVRQLVKAHAYWRLKGLAVDLVVWNEEHGGYRQLLHDQIMGLIAAGQEANVIDRPGGIFVRSAEQISNEDRVLLQAVARVVLTDSQGTLADQVRRRPAGDPLIPEFAATRALTAIAPAAASPAPGPLLLGNGLGGFAPGGQEYVITTAAGMRTPAPWVNVLANPQFGSVVSESGSAYTWQGNAHAYRLTPWNNDAVSDASGEACYLRDEETGRFWSTTALPCGGDGPHVARHGFGYSVFEHTEDGIASELTVYVALDLPVKFSVLRLRNLSGRPRRLSATGYAEWVLGTSRSRSAMHVVTELDANGGALLARNTFNPEFSGQVAFFDVDDVTRSISGDRTEFIGRNGTLRAPAALLRARLSGRLGAGMDPCAAIQVPFELPDGATREIIFRMGVGSGVDGASRLVQRLRKPGTARAALAEVRAYWSRTLGAVRIETPDQPLDLLCNGWLLYQVMSSRLWGRSGHYQSGGAFGFRDQLQDVMALLHNEPALVREHLLRCAARQFVEGDVQHWWHPPAGRGVRTRCSDDFLWLPLAVSRYVLATGDTTVLGEPAAFLDGRAVNPEEDSYYDLPLRSPERASLYQHCVRAIVHGLRFGVHGLPLMGTGDWNDGMNLVGAHGKGESVWLGFFLHHVLTQFAPVARMEDDAPFAARCESEALRLARQLEAHGWDGGWYRRAYFDDGTPLGSAGNAECQIDSIAQSWSVLSGVGAPERTRTAMAALDRRLVRREHSLIQLLDPPFDQSDQDPGYIRGYVPGVRENGGQYTHAGIWAAMAFAAQGDAELAWMLTGMLNPLRHGASAAGMERYKVEPYVLAADVYAVAPHIGRGGWTWYTGSAGWMYRLVTESLLGLQLRDGRLHFTPCLPPEWTQFKLQYRHIETTYHIVVRQSPGAAPLLTLDGVAQAEASLLLRNDRMDHQAEFTLPSRVRQTRAA